MNTTKKAHKSYLTTTWKVLWKILIGKRHVLVDLSKSKKK
jgi:hypothetical protein